MELFSYEEPFKITIAIKKIDYLLFIHILLTDCPVRFHLHLYISIVQSYIPTLKAFLFQLPIQNSSCTSKYVPFCRQKSNRGNPPQHRIISTFSPKASKPLRRQDTTPTACQIPPAAPFEKSSLLRSPVLCHSALWVVLCKMKRQFHDLALLIKGSTLTVYL